MRRRLRTLLIALGCLGVGGLGVVLLARSATYRAWRFERGAEALRSLIAERKAEGARTSDDPALGLLLSLTREQARRGIYPRVLEFEELVPEQQRLFRQVLLHFPAVPRDRRTDLLPVGISVYTNGVTFIASLDGERRQFTLGGLAPPNKRRD